MLSRPGAYIRKFASSAHNRLSMVMEGGRVKLSNASKPTVHVLQPLGVYIYLTCPVTGTLLSPLNIAIICVCMCVCVCCVCVCVYVCVLFVCVCVS